MGQLNSTYLLSVIRGRWMYHDVSIVPLGYGINKLPSCKVVNGYPEGYPY